MNRKPVFLNPTGVLQQIDPDVDYLLTKGVIDTSGNSITIEDIKNNSHKHVIEVIIISLAQVASKAIDLVNTPDSTSQVKMYIQGAGAQILGQDYNVSGSSIVWTGLGIDGVLAENDIVKIEYSIK